MSTLKRFLGYALATASLGLCFMVAVATVAPAADKGGKIPTAGPENIFADVPVAPVSWTGVYVGAAYGYGAADGVLSHTVAPLAAFDGLSATGQFENVILGGRVQIPHTYLVLGARGGYEWSQQELSAKILTKSAHVGIDKGWFADAIVGVAFGTALPYVGMGRSVMQTEGSDFSGKAITGLPDLKSTRYIGGVEFRLPKIDTGGMFTPTLGLEVVYSDADTLAVGTHTNLDVSNWQGMVRLNLQIWK